MSYFTLTEDVYQQQAVIDGEPALLDILDTAGQVNHNKNKSSMKFYSFSLFRLSSQL